jgi:hypothetical protein
MRLTERLETIVKEGGLSQLLREIKGGKMDANAVSDEYAQQYRPKAQDLVERFQRGDLFVAQRQNFDDWSNCVDRWRDRKQMEEVYGIFYQANLPVERNIAIFASERIWYPSPYDRKKGLERGDFARQEWVKVNQRNGWTWGAKDEF